MNSGFIGIEGKFVTNTAYVDKTERDGAGKAETPLWLKSELPAEQVLVCATPVRPASFFSILPPKRKSNLLYPALSHHTSRALHNYSVLPAVILFLCSDAAPDFSRGTLQVRFLGVGCNPWLSSTFPWSICLWRFFFVVGHLMLQIHCAKNPLSRKQS